MVLIGTSKATSENRKLGIGDTSLKKKVLGVRLANGEENQDAEV